MMVWVGPIEVLQVDGPMDLFTRRRRNSAGFDSVKLRLEWAAALRIEERQRRVGIAVLDQTSLDAGR